MIINSKKWLRSLVVKKISEDDVEKYNLNSDKWIHTLPSENKRNPIKNYSMVMVLFITGLMFVSVIKNETRNLQKNINSFQKSINTLKVDLHQETLDHEIITSPENLTLLAKEYLDIDLIPYKRPQIEKLKNKKVYNENENLNLKTELKKNITKKIQEKKLKLAKLKRVYSNPQEIPAEIKLTLSKKIETKKSQIYQLYKNPKETISMDKTQKWVLLQVAKLFVGIPIVPGK